MLAVSDKELIGKVLKQDDLEFKVSEYFYKGEEIDETGLRELLKEAGNINLIGNKAVSIALEEKLGSAEQVIEIQGVKHLQILMI